MGGLLQNSFAVVPKGPGLLHKHPRCFAKCRKKNFVNCLSGRNVIKSDNLASVVPERSMFDPSSSLVLTPNGKSPADVIVKDLVPYNGSCITPPTHITEGIGIVKFLRGKSYFVTGATGFLAKAIIEKLLRTVPDVGKIYVLIKSKNNEAAEKRLEKEIINAEIFKCLRQMYGKSYEAFMLSKLVPVAGNVCETNLGLDENSIKMITENVDVIVNSAANTNFHERYDVALDINTRGPVRVMAFANRCKKLNIFLQVSTAYVNGQRQGRILERPFRLGETIVNENLSSPIPLLDLEDELNLAQRLAKDYGVGKATQKMKDVGLERARKYGWQDTYVFTKAMGEMWLGSMRGDIPVVILRPSVIESTYRDPFPGWIEGNRMMDPVVTCYGKGQLPGFHVDPDGVIDVVPADMVVNATLAAIAKHGMAGKPEINVYQVASSVVNPLMYRDLGHLIHQHFTKLPCHDTEGRPIQVEPFRFDASMDDFSSHNGKHCRKTLEQAKHFARVYKPYAFYGGRFDNSKTGLLMECMSEEEKKSFSFDVGGIDWEDYICNVHIPGLRRHVMKERRQNN